MKHLIAFFLPIISIPVFSRVWGRIVRLKHPRLLVKRIIEYYRKSYSIDMDNYEGEEGDYSSLSDFFIRRLDPERRLLVPDESAIVSPADGMLTEIETVFEDRAVQVKGKYYSISELLKENIDFPGGWHIATIYLSPSDYHRYHYPLTGKIRRYIHTGGKLFPVNQVGLNNISKLLVRNQRIVTEIVKNEMSCYMVAIGAAFVGSIKMEFITFPKRRRCWEDVNLDARQLEEMGRFEMGSTIVLVIPKKMADPVDAVKGQLVCVGEPLFRFA